jgi:hypothetical protein
MRGDPQATSARLVPTMRRRRWLSSLTRRRRRIKQDELELIERLARLEREARRSGTYVPKLGPQRPWF